MHVLFSSNPGHKTPHGYTVAFHLRGGTETPHRVVDAYYSRGLAVYR